MTVIGVNWAGNASSPTLTRIGIDGTHSTYTGPVSAGTPFNTFGPWAGMQRVNVYDDGTVTTNWGTRCYSDTSTNLGQVMVQIPQFLFFTDPSDYNGGQARYYIGETSDIGVTIQTTGIAPAHTMAQSDVHPLFNVDGNYVDYAYVSAFEGYWDPTTLMMDSVAGVPPTTFTTNTLARSYAEARDTGWELMNIQALSALQLLFIVEYATLNSQAALGNGIVSASGIANTGATGTPGTDRGNLSYGTTSNSTTAMSYRGVENLWGNLQNVVDGLNVDTSNYAWIAPQSRTRPTYYEWELNASPYVKQSSTITNAGAGGWMKRPNQTATGSWNFLIGATGASSSTYFCNECWEATTGLLVLNQGGNYNDSTGAGLFAQRYTVTDATPAGARLQYLPSS